MKTKPKKQNVGRTQIGFALALYFLSTIISGGLVAISSFQYAMSLHNIDRSLNLFNTELMMLRTHGIDTELAESTLNGTLLGKYALYQYSFGNVMSTSFILILAIAAFCFSIALLFREMDVILQKLADMEDRYYAYATGS